MIHKIVKTDSVVPLSTSIQVVGILLVICIRRGQSHARSTITLYSLLALVLEYTRRYVALWLGPKLFPQKTARLDRP